MTSVDYSNRDSISTLHPDIIQTQILTRLDGLTLASTASTSSYLQTLCSEQKLWREISTAMWPSINDPRVVKAISSFPSGYISFFADSYPFTEHTWQPENHDPPTTGLISAVDLYYRGELIYSKVQEMDTENGKEGWFLSTPFRVDMVDPKESVKTRIRYPGGDYEVWVRDMEESMKLDWIMIDPIKKRAANISSRRAVSAKRNWLTGDLEIRFSTVTTAGKKAVEVAAVVSCGSAETWKEVDEEVGGEVHVRDVRLQVEDIEGKCLKGKDSLVILQGLLEGKRCCKDGGGEERSRGKGRYEEYVEMKTQWREKNQRREKAQDTNAKAVRLRSHHDKYLIADEDEESVTQERNGSAGAARWTVEQVPGSSNLIRLKGAYGKYLTASNKPFLLGATGRKVLQTKPSRLDSSLAWEPIRDGALVKLKTRYGHYLRGNGGLPPWRNSITHDIPHRSATQDWILWHVDVVEILTDQHNQPPSPLHHSDSLDFGPGSPSRSNRFFRQESTDSLAVGSPPKSEGRVIYYHVADDDGEVEDDSVEVNSFTFKGNGVEELTKRLKEESNVEDVIVCTRSPLNGKLFPLRLQLPPNNADMTVVLVPISSKIAEEFIK